jgi:hypothetical protein
MRGQSAGVGCEIADLWDNASALALQVTRLSVMAKRNTMRSIRSLQLCAMGFLACVPSAHCQKDITLRFIDAGSGKPIAGISVSIFAWDENRGGSKPAAPDALKINRNSQVVKTDKEGKAIFYLNDDPTLKILYIDTTGDLRGCSAHEFPIAQVLRTGLIASYRIGKPKWCVALKAQTTPKRGEIVIFDKRVTVFDRMRREIP